MDPYSGDLHLESSDVNSKRHQVLTALSQHVFNHLPAHLIRVSDMKLLSRMELWEDLCAQIDQPDPDPSTISQHLVALRMPKGNVHARVKYAIFSHRWGAQEPSYQQVSQRDEQWVNNVTSTTASSSTAAAATATSNSNSGLFKLVSFCDKARAYGCAYAWSDTCCIDKSSSAELEEAVRAMYRWYRDAEVCIVHLAATDTLADFEREPWFRRGWTLQELLAPRRVVFYARDWTPISGITNNDNSFARRIETRNDKKDWRILGTVSMVTGIPAGDLRHFRPGCDRVSEKMRWASLRETTRQEDVAYALIGIFDITIPIAYGEGKWAFHRLMEAIAQRCSEPGFFACAGDASPHSFALPSSPASYGTSVLDSQTATGLRLTGSVFEEVGDRSYSITKLGLKVKLLLLPAQWIHEESCGSYILSFKEGTFSETGPRPTLSQAYYEIFRPEQCVLGVVNYTRVGDRGSLRVGEHYFSLLLKRGEGSDYIKARTDNVLVWRCVEGVTKDLEEVCLLNTLSSYDHDIN